MEKHAADLDRLCQAEGVSESPLRRRLHRRLRAVRILAAPSRTVRCARALQHARRRQKPRRAARIVCSIADQVLQEGTAAFIEDMLGRLLGLDHEDGAARDR